MVGADAKSAAAPKVKLLIDDECMLAGVDAADGGREAKFSIVAPSGMVSTASHSDGHRKCSGCQR